MKNLRKIMIVALFGAMSFGAYSTYEYTTMTNAERFMLRNVEALTNGEASLAVECYDKYKAYAGGSAQRFRPCDAKPTCEHIWAYSPSRRTICQ